MFDEEMNFILILIYQKIINFDWAILSGIVGNFHTELTPGSVIIALRYFYRVYTARCYCHCRSAVA